METGIRFSIKIRGMLKRVTDIVGAVAGLFLISPLIPFIVIAIKLDSRGPVVVRLERVSADRVIRIYKFRTMIEGARAMEKSLAHLNERDDGPYFKITNDPRRTRIGRWLRRYRLDEFPQLINVLKNELSLVGPRPYKPEEVAEYPPDFDHIPKFKAGVTGLSQVNGSSSLPFARTLELDDFYIKNRTLGLDFKIIIKTLAMLLVDKTAV